jgi:hypothetical protein
MMIFLTAMIALIAAAIAGSVVVTVRDGYRRVPTR